MAEEAPILRDQLDLEELDRQITHSAKVWQRIRKVTLYTLIFSIAVSFFYPSSALVFGSSWNSLVNNIVTVLPFAVVLVSTVFTLILGMREETMRWRRGYEALRQSVSNIQPPCIGGFVILHYRRFISYALALTALLLAITNRGIELLLIYLLFNFARGYIYRWLYLWPYRGAFQRGDYKGAMRRANILWGVLIGRSGYLATRTSLLLMMGQFAEAEQIARKALMRTKNDPAELSSALYMLGRALLGQKRYDEVLTCYEGAINLYPGYAPYYNGLVNYYLEQEAELKRALAVLQQALAYNQKPKPNQFLEMFQWTGLKGTEARLFVLLGYRQKANAALEAAFDATSPEFAPALADLHLDAGFVSERADDVAGAQSHYEQARLLDPNGTMGQKALDALTALRNHSEQPTSS